MVRSQNHFYLRSRMVNTDRYHRTRALYPMSVTSCLWVFIMAGALLGEIFGAKGKSDLIEGLVSGYLQDEGQLNIEDRTIVYKASIRAFSFPVIYDATAQDTATGITATSEDFDDPQDAYHKAVANLLAILRQRGLMKDQTPKTKPDSVPPTPEPIMPPEPDPVVVKPEPSPTPKSVPEQQDPLPESPSEMDPDETNIPTLDLELNHGSESGQASRWQSDPTLDLEIKEPTLEPEPTSKEAEPGQDFVVNRPPDQDSVLDGAKLSLEQEYEDISSPSGNSDQGQETEEPTGDQGQLNDSGWFEWLFQLLCTLATTAILKCFRRPPLETTFVGALGVLVVGSVLYTQGSNIFLTGIVAIGLFVIIETVPVHFQRAAVLVLKLVKSLPNLLAVTPPAGFFLEVVPDYQGSYAAYTIKQAHPTADMLSPRYTYKLWSQCKGMAFILNNITFARGERLGSEIDLDNVVHLFQELGYMIILHNDLTGQEILNSIRSFASMFNQEGARYDSAVIVLMSHGDTGVILGTDLAQVKLRDLQRELEGDRCPGLNGKPKMYFVQACRGHLTPTLPVVADGPSSLGAHDGSSHHRHEGLLHVQPDNHFASNLQDVADVHFAFASIEGHLSLRSEVIGSFFVQALCEVFFANAHQDNLDTLMNKVTDRVNRMKGKLYDHESGQWILVNQTPECVKRMRKALYFLPKYTKNR